MRYLLAIDLPAAMRRGVSVEQFLGRSPLDAECIRHVELRPSDGVVEVWVFDVEDLGDEQWCDIYGFPYLEPDGPDGPVAVFHEAHAAAQYASTTLAADPARWVNLGVGASEYIDYMRAGRPLRWPVPVR